jgi:hypothetical protein
VDRPRDWERDGGGPKPPRLEDRKSGRAVVAYQERRGPPPLCQEERRSRVVDIANVID